MASASWFALASQQLTSVHAPGPVIESLECRRLLAGGPPLDAAVTGLAVVDPATQQPIPGFQLTYGSVIDLATLPGRAQVVALLSEQGIGSVRFNVDGIADYRLDNAAPYTLSASSDTLWALGPGIHTMVVTPYSSTDGQGSPGKSFVTEVNVIDSRTVAPVCVDAGGRAYPDGQGNTFLSDRGFVGGREYATFLNIAGTKDATLYRSGRTGRLFTFSSRVPNGLYDLILYFAEPMRRQAGSRLFSVWAEGRQILDRYDIAADVGTLTAVSKTSQVVIGDGKLNLTFVGIRGDALVSAVRLAPVRAPRNPEALRINAGGPAFSDSLKRTFLPDVGFSGGRAGSSVYDVQATDDDPLFQNYREGNVTLHQPVANGHYALWLEFADPTSTQAGQRVFDVWAEGQQILSSYDIFADRGFQTAAAKCFNVEVKDGRIDLAFQGVTGNAIVSAVMLLPTDPPNNVVHQVADPVISASQLRQIGQWTMLYADDHRGKTPVDRTQLADWMGESYGIFADLRAGYDLPRGDLSPLEGTAWVATRDDYIYVANGQSCARVTPDAVMAYENPSLVYGEALGVLFWDGHVEFVTRAALASLLGTDVPVGPGTPVTRPIGLDDPAIVQSMVNLANLATPLRNWAMDHRGVYPTDLGSSEYGVVGGVDLSLLCNPRLGPSSVPSGLTPEQKVAWIDQQRDYLYAGAAKRMSGSAEDVLVYENPAAMGNGINLLFLDGSIEFREMRWAIETLARRNAIA